MRFVILLGALALMALSTTAENQDKAIDLPGKDILIREVRETERNGQKKISKGKKRRSRKTKAAKRKGNKNKEGNRRGNRRRNNKNKKYKKEKEKTRGKSALQNNRQTSREDGCDAFYDKDNTEEVRDFRYARNQLQKARRAKNRINKLEKLTAKAAEAFLAGAAFYKDCSDPRAAAVYEGLSQCNVTAANACNPAALMGTPDYAEIDICISALKSSLNSSEPCLTRGQCDAETCDYQKIGMTSRSCDYIQFEKDVSELLNSKCSNSTYEGSFTWCNNLLKDSYPIASNCSCTPTLTTVAPYSGRRTGRMIELKFLKMSNEM